MKLLHIYGGEYAALNLVESSIGVEGAYKLAKELGGYVSISLEEGDEPINAKIYSFAEVDPAFIAFIKERFLPYDRSKHEDFFVMDNGG